MANIRSMHDETGEDMHTLLAGKLQGQTTLWRPRSTCRYESAINPWIMQQKNFLLLLYLVYFVPIFLTLFSQIF